MSFVGKFKALNDKFKSVRGSSSNNDASSDAANVLGGTMSNLTDIQEVFPDLDLDGIHTDSDLRSLDRKDLQELLPGIQNLRKRRRLFDRIYQGPSADTTSRPRHEDEALLAKIKEFNPRAAEVLIEKNCLDNIDFLDRVDLLELFPKTGDLMLRKKVFEIIQTQMPAESTADKHPKGFSMLDKKEVNFQILYSGKSLSIYQEVIKKVKSKTGVRFSETTSNPKVSLLFCPIISRIGSDAEAAIACIPDDKPVILVFLIHSFTAQSLSLMRSWDDSQIVLHVHLFHHETKSGLLRCKENNKAISDIQNKLLEYREDNKTTEGNHS